MEGGSQVVASCLRLCLSLCVAPPTSTGLYCAAWAGHENCVRKLIQFGAVLNVRKDGGFTPLFCAAENNRVVSGPLFLIELRLSGDSDMVRCHCQCVTRAESVLAPSPVYCRVASAWFCFHRISKCIAESCFTHLPAP
jgi:hypothetical protein